MKYPTIEFDQYKKEQWTEEESNNVKTVIDFFQHLMNEHDFEYTLKTYGGGSYTQHNRAIPNHIEGLVAYVKKLTKRYPEYSFNVKKVIADGDMVMLHSHTTMSKKDRGNENKGFIIMDTFRLENGKLVEHWDSMQAIDFMTRLLFMMVGGERGNSNPIF